MLCGLGVANHCFIAWPDFGVRRSEQASGLSVFLDRYAVVWYSSERLGASVINAGVVLDTTATMGVQASGQGDRLSLPGPGKQADLFMFDPLRPGLAPLLDPMASPVRAAGPGSAAAGVLAGQVVLDEECVTTGDQAALLRKAQPVAWDLAQRAGRVRLL